MLFYIKYCIFAVTNFAYQRCLVLTWMTCFTVFMKCSSCFFLLGFVLCAAGLSLLRRFPFGQQNQTDHSSAAVSHNSLFLPVPRGRVLRANRWVYPEHFVPQLSFLQWPRDPELGEKWVWKMDVGMFSLRCRQIWRRQWGFFRPLWPFN